MQKITFLIVGVAVLVTAGVFIAPSLTSDRIPAALLPAASDAPSALQAAALDSFRDLFGASDVVVLEPVEDFLDRATIKRYGTYITPDTSPIQGDRFTGYHTGIDAEFTDTDADIPVVAIADGTIALSDWVKGYGGVIVIRHVINDVPVFALYGHLDEQSFTKAVGDRVAAGSQIAVLGEGHSTETDGVRKHLHFSILTRDTIDLRGYVQTEAELAPWLNPLDLYR